jgi:hypothetical protein
MPTMSAITSIIDSNGAGAVDVRSALAWAGETATVADVEELGIEWSGRGSSGAAARVALPQAEGRLCQRVCSTVNRVGVTRGYVAGATAMRRCVTLKQARQGIPAGSIASSKKAGRSRCLQRMGQKAGSPALSSAGCQYVSGSGATVGRFRMLSVDPIRSSSTCTPFSDCV